MVWQDRVPVGAWRNGKRARLRTWWTSVLVGSNPSAPTTAPRRALLGEGAALGEAGRRVWRAVALLHRWNLQGRGTPLRSGVAPQPRTYPNTLAPVVCAGEGASLFAGG